MGPELKSIQHFQDIGWRSPSEIGFSKKTLLGEIRANSVLDIGCGDGLLLKELLVSGKIEKAAGLDVSPNAIELARKNGIDCRIFNVVEPLPFEDESFDAVLLVDILEHLFEPLIVLKEAARVSKKEVYISVPNFNSLPARFQMLFGETPENNTSRKGHVHWMNRGIIFELIHDAGLSVKKMIVNSFRPRIIFEPLAKIFPGIFALSFVIKTEKWRS